MDEQTHNNFIPSTSTVDSEVKTKEPWWCIYDVSSRAIEHLSVCLWIPPNFLSLGLNIKSGRLQLPPSSLIKEFEVAECRFQMMHRDTNRGNVRRVITSLGHKWTAQSHSGTHRQQAEVEGHCQEHMHRQTDKELDPRRLKAEERSDPSRGLTPGGGRVTVKGLWNVDH